MKFFKSLITMMLFVLAVLAFNACGSSDPAKDVFDKINAHQQLTADDYAVMVDYFSQAADFAKKTAESVITESPEKQRAAMNSFESKFPYAEAFGEALFNAPDGTLDEQLQHKFGEAINSMIDSSRILR